MLASAGDAGNGTALAAFDVPLGAPLTALQSTGAATFLEWLDSRVFETNPVTAASDWSPRRPFAVPVGRGSWKAIELVAKQNGFDLKRHLDRAVGAESMFKLIGPKQVGAAARALWNELIESRNRGVQFRVWPFETDDLTGDGLTVAEIDPAAAYGVVLERRPGAKGDPAVRAGCLEQVQHSDWFARLGMKLDDGAFAASTSDDFDAAITALATLRLALEGRTLTTRSDPVAEGGMLCV